MRRIESEIETIKANQKVDGMLIDGKLTQMSRVVHSMSKVLDEFQDTHLIIKRLDGETIDE